MKTLVIAFLIGLLAPLHAFGKEPDSFNTAASAARLDGPLTRAIVLEATRLSKSPPVQSAQPQGSGERRHWCRRHPIGCGTLAGLGTGFVVGLASAPEDFEAMGFAIIFGAPIGAGIGAAAGWIVATATKPQQP